MERIFKYQKQEIIGGGGSHENDGEIVEVVHENDTDCMIPKVVGGLVLTIGTTTWTNQYNCVM